MTIMHSKMAPRPSQEIKPQGHCILFLRYIEGKDMSSRTPNSGGSQLNLSHRISKRQVMKSTALPAQGNKETQWLCRSCTMTWLELK